MERRQIRRILQTVDLRDLSEISARSILDPDRGRAVRAQADRHKESDTPFVCKLCQNIVIVPMHPRTKEYYFKHWHKNVECPWTSENGTSVDTVNSIIFGGRQEGPLHKRIVQETAQLLSASKNVTSVWRDERYTSPTVGDWKKPDLRFIYNGQMFVFEVQLATTQRPIITERNAFYLREKIPIIWATWTPPQIGLLEHKASVIDIITDHHDNLFSFDEATIQQTKDSGVFCLRVHWWEGNRCRNKMIAFDDLIIPDDTLPYVVEKPKPWCEELKNEWVLLGDRKHISNEDMERLWSTLMAQTEWPQVSDQPELDWDIVSLIGLLLSMERNSIVNSGQQNLTEMLHTFLTTQGRKPMARIVERAAGKAGHSKLFDRAKTRELLTAAKLTDQLHKNDFAPRLVRALFPNWL